MRARKRCEPVWCVALATVAVLLTPLPAVAWSEAVENRPTQGRGCGLQPGALESIPAGLLNEKEAANLVRLREEEKLARDVYRTLGERWEVPIFEHISASEQRHMDAVGMLLQRYEIDDPVGDDLRGRFASRELQEIYDRLIARGEISPQEAMQVGATVEDLDIFDLLRMREETELADLQLVFDHLTRGSRNHLRAFSGHLEDYGLAYSAQYLTQEQIASILEGDHERGGGRRMAGGGRGAGRGQRGGCCGGCRSTARGPKPPAEESASAVVGAL